MQNDDYTVQSYQDDLDNENKPDPFMDEVADAPAVVMGVSDEELKTEFDKDIDDDEENLDGADVDIVAEDLAGDLKKIPDDRGY